MEHIFLLFPFLSAAVSILCLDFEHDDVIVPTNDNPKLLNVCYTRSSAVIPYHALLHSNSSPTTNYFTSSLPGAARYIIIGSLDSNLSTCNETKLS